MNGVEGSKLRSSKRLRLPMSDLSVNRTASKLRLQVPCVLRAPAAGYLERYAG